MDPIEPRLVSPPPQREVRVQSGVALGVKIALGFVLFGALAITGSCAACYMLVEGPGAIFGTPRPPAEGASMLQPPSAPVPSFVEILDADDRDSGRYVRKQEVAPCALQIEGAAITLLPDPENSWTPEEERIRDADLRLDLQLGNTGDRAVRPFRLTVQVLDAFDEVLVSELVLDGKSTEVRPGEAATPAFRLRRNAWLKGAARVLRDRDPRDLKFAITKCQVAYAD